MKLVFGNCQSKSLGDFYFCVELNDDFPDSEIREFIENRYGDDIVKESISYHTETGWHKNSRGEYYVSF